MLHLNGCFTYVSDGAHIEAEVSSNRISFRFFPEKKMDCQRMTSYFILQSETSKENINL